MLHKRQRLPFRVKPSDHFLGIHPWLDDLQRNFALHRLGLFSDIDDPHPAFADLLANCVRADP